MVTLFITLSLKELHGLHYVKYKTPLAITPLRTAELHSSLLPSVNNSTQLELNRPRDLDGKRDQKGKKSKSL